MSPLRLAPLLTAALIALPGLSMAQTPAKPAEPADQFLHFVKARTAEWRASDQPPASLADWTAQRSRLREHLVKAWGNWPATPAPLNPRKLGELQRDGYRVEKVIFQTLPNVWMTANAYVPAKPGRLPTVLCVHGHWRGAKQDPVVQSRCIGLAKLGFFVLVVDAFGAGERGVGKALGEYHGEMTAATLFPVGLPLSGLQVYENMRAVDYLLTRPEVDGTRLGITGASGGGNQTMYAGAFDERLKAVVPVCSVGNYQAYLGAACCMCEVVPGALRFTEEWGLLAMVAPRALMVVSATKDAPQFSVGEAKKSLALAQPVFALHGKPANVHHAIFESPHAYNQAMREAMYGWMTKHLKGEGDGSPIAEPKFDTEDPETLRCFPGQTRPDDWMTIPRFAAASAQAALAQSSLSPAQFRTQAPKKLATLENEILGGTPPPPLKVASTSQSGPTAFSPESGLRLVAGASASQSRSGAVLILQLEDPSGLGLELERELKASGLRTLNISLRSRGEQAPKNDQIGRAPDHNSAEWSMWLGRPLLGQWVVDVRRGLDALGVDGKQQVTVVGVGSAGVVALCAAALDQRLSRVVTIGSLASYVTDVPYEGQRLGILAPGIVRDVGDIPQLAALLAPRKLLIAGGVTGGGQPLDVASLHEQFKFTRQVYEHREAAAALSFLSSPNAAEVAKALTR